MNKTKLTSYTKATESCTDVTEMKMRRRHAFYADSPLEDCVQLVCRDPTASPASAAVIGHITDHDPTRLSHSDSGWYSLIERLQFVLIECCGVSCLSHTEVGCDDVTQLLWEWHWLRVVPELHFRLTGLPLSSEHGAPGYRRRGDLHWTDEAEALQ